MGMFNNEKNKNSKANFKLNNNIHNNNVVKTEKKKREMIATNQNTLTRLKALKITKNKKTISDTIDDLINLQIEKLDQKDSQTYSSAIQYINNQNKLAAKLK